MLWQKGVRELVELIRRGEVKPSEVVESWTASGRRAGSSGYLLPSRTT